jgi:hypothetical protein
MYAGIYVVINVVPSVRMEMTFVVSFGTSGPKILLAQIDKTWGYYAKAEAVNFVNCVIKIENIDRGYLKTIPRQINTKFLYSNVV